MLKSALLSCLLLLSVSALFSQGDGGRDSIGSGRPYRIKKSVDIPLIVGGAAYTLYGFGQIQNKDGSTLQQVQDLRESNINWFDRWAVHPYSKNTDNASYIPFFVAMPLPLAVFGIDKKMRKDFWQLSSLYAEAMIMTGVLYTSAVHFVNRYRPLVYRSESPVDTRRSANSRNSFFAGHVALVATSTFFIAQAYADYHPDSHCKWLFYTGAGVLTAGTGYLRNKAGEHFPTDIALGTAIGTLSGLLTPALHRTKLMRNHRLSILPFGGQQSQGLALLYKL